MANYNAAGGTITLGNLTLVIPQGALPGDTQIDVQLWPVNFPATPGYVVYKTWRVTADPPRTLAQPATFSYTLVAGWVESRLHFRSHPDVTMPLPDHGAELGNAPFGNGSADGATPTLPPPGAYGSFPTSGTMYLGLLMYPP